MQQGRPGRPQAGLRNVKAGNSNRNGESDSSKYKGESSKTLEGTDVKKTRGAPFRLSPLLWSGASTDECPKSFLESYIHDE